MKPTIIVSETKRPLWQICIAALFFTLATALTIYTLFNFQFTENKLKFTLIDFKNVFFLFLAGISFSSIKRIHLDIKNSRFRPTNEVGFLKFGAWKTIKNYEYVSIFRQKFKDGSYCFEVNLWYNRNKHFKLYEQNNFQDAFIVGYDLSKQLDIKLLDATIPNDFKWITKNDYNTASKSQK